MDNLSKESIIKKLKNHLQKGNLIFYADKFKAVVNREDLVPGQWILYNPQDKKFYTATGNSKEASVLVDETNSKEILTNIEFDICIDLQGVKDILEKIAEDKLDEEKRKAEVEEFFNNKL